MKNRMKIIAVLLAATLTMGACGAKESINETVVSTETVAVESTEVVETTEEVVEATKEVVETVVATESTEVEEDVFTIEAGMAKIDKLMEAHDVLLSQGKILENNIQNTVESLTAKNWNLTQFTTADGEPFKTKGAVYAMGIHYYNELVNNEKEYYDFEEWLNSQENNDSLYKYAPGIEAEKWDTNNILLLEAIGVVAYLKSCESIQPVELIETTDYTISGVQSAYAIPLDCDGDTALTAVYDIDGRLLNICTPDDGSWDKYMSSFPDGIPSTN